MSWATCTFDGRAPVPRHGRRPVGIEVIAGIGALILLFEVGVESTIGQMLRVGKTALFVAVLGVVAPFALGWGVGAVLLPSASPYAHAFLGATLCATSVQYHPHRQVLRISAPRAVWKRVSSSVPPSSTMSSA